MRHTLAWALEDIAKERARQDEKFPLQRLPHGTSVGYLSLADMARALCDRKAAEGTLTWQDILAEETLEAYSETDPVKLREELVQVAAVAVRWIEQIDADAAHERVVQASVGEARLPDGLA